MLTISAQQFATLEAHQTREFVDRLIAFLRQHIPQDRDVPTEELRSQITPLVEKARVYGLTTEQQAAGYVLVAHNLGSDFDQTNAQAATILRSTYADGDNKLERLQALI